MVLGSCSSGLVRGGSCELFFLLERKRGESGLSWSCCPEPEGRAALSSSYQILLTPSTRTADAAADGSLISFLLALDLGWHCLAKLEIEWLGLVFPG